MKQPSKQQLRDQISQLQMQLFHARRDAEQINLLCKYLNKHSETEHIIKTAKAVDTTAPYINVPVMSAIEFINHDDVSEMAIPTICNVTVSKTLLNIIDCVEKA